MRPAGGRERYKVGQSRPPRPPSGFCSALSIASDPYSSYPDDRAAEGASGSSGGTLRQSEEKRKQPPREIQSSHLTVPRHYSAPACRARTLTAEGLWARQGRKVKIMFYSVNLLSPHTT